MNPLGTGPQSREALKRDSQEEMWKVCGEGTVKEEIRG